MTPASPASSTSSLPEPSTLSAGSRNKSSKSKANKHGRSEGEDLNWAYKPPEGMSLVESIPDAGEFDWDAVEGDSDTELWIIRVPESVKPKHLENLTLELGDASKTSHAGTLKRKHTSFDVWSVGDGDENDEHFVGGEEIKSMSCLLPRKKQAGELRIASKPIARRLIVSAQDVSPAENATEPVNIIRQNPPRPSYPKDVLKHQFMPYGSLSASKAGHEIEVDKSPQEPAAISSSPKTPKYHRGSKRKEAEEVGSDASKKSKKAKTSRSRK